MTARDLRYGRRGGRWAGTTAGPDLAGAARCQTCGGPLLVGQVIAHAACSDLATAFPRTYYRCACGRSVRHGDDCPICAPAQLVEVA